ncbi:MAG TPA: hypothetical protein VE338_06080 [Ktedonobacterales bacterium]|jgi:anti-sigma factor RsiW|nr:hypothetical protein [Ktedonobacterales bacterium]
MSDEMTPRDFQKGASGATLTCAAGVTPERLSAWRDGLLPADQAGWMASHATTCPACAARLRDYEQIGAALRGQIIPRSEVDPWPAMRLRLTRQRRRGLRLPTAPRWGGLGALIAAGLLIALFAGLLAQQASRRPTPASTATVARATTTTAASTPTVAAGTWAPIDAYTGVAGLVVAPSDPRVAYQIWLDQQKGSPTAVILRRTDDQGATWQTLTPPSIVSAAGPNYPQLFTGFVSPLDAHVVFLITDAQAGAACGSNGYTKDGYCQLEYISVDGGERWQPLQLPTLGLMTAQVININGHPQIAGDIQAQGQRLYSVESNTNLGAQTAPPPARLIASDNGGRTWSLIDAPFRAAGQGVYDYAATPGGSTVFVVTQPLNQQIGPNVAAPSLMLWRSSDAGATWTQLGQPPQNAVTDMRAAWDVSTRTPILYIENTVSKGQFVIQASRDGVIGAFTQAPNPPMQGQSYQDRTFLTTLSDGSLVISNAGVVEAWNLSDKAANWKQLADPVTLQRYNSVLLQAQTDGARRLWLIGMDTSQQVVEYTPLP